MRGRPNYLLAHRHAETKLVVLVDVVHLGGKDEVQTDVEALLEESGDDAVVIDATANSALSQDVVVSNAGRGAALIPVPQEIGRQHRLFTHFQAVCERQQARRRHLPCRDSLIIRVPRGESDA